MKNTSLYIIGGFTFAALAGIAVYEWRKNNGKAAALASNNQMIADSGTTPSLMKFKGFNFDLLLNENTKRAVAEVTALQREINAYYGGSQSIDVTGVFDTQTKNAVNDIVGKTETSLTEFNFKYLAKKRGQKAATDLISSMTITGG